MGSKTAARLAAIRAGVPVVPGTEQPLAADVADADNRRGRGAVGYPLLVKAVAGGGGKGHAHGRPTPPISPAPCAPRGRKRGGVRRRGGLPRTPADPAAPHRSAAPRRRARHGAAVRRARVLDSAAASESRRGDAVACRVAGAARAHHVRRGRRRRLVPVLTNSSPSLPVSSWFLKPSINIGVRRPA